MTTSGVRTPYGLPRAAGALRNGLLFAALSLAVSTAAIAQQTTWDMATSSSGETAIGRATQLFVANLSARAEGQFAIAAYAPNSLMKPPEIKDAVRRGVVPIGEFTLSLHGGEAAIYGLDSVPFMATSYAAARRLYEAQRPFLEKRLAEEGLKLLYSGPYLPQGFCSDRAIGSAADLRGLRLRSYNHVTKKLALLTGATPISVETGEIPAAMRSQRLDIFTASVGQVAARKIWTFAPYFHDLAIWIPRNAVVANKGQFDALPAEQRKAMVDAAKFAEDRAWEAAEKDYAERRAFLTSAGATVIVSSELLGSFGEVAAKIAEEWAKAAGPDGEAILQAYRK